MYIKLNVFSWANKKRCILAKIAREVQKLLNQYTLNQVFSLINQPGMQYVWSNVATVTLKK